MTHACKYVLFQDAIGSEVGGAVGGGATGPQLVIWGTDVDVNRCKERFKRFLERYIDPTVEADEKFDGMDVEEPIYMQRLEEVPQTFSPYWNGDPRISVVEMHVRGNFV